MGSSDILFACLAAILGGFSSVFAGIALGALRVLGSKIRREALFRMWRERGGRASARFYLLERRNTTEPSQPRVAVH